MGYNMMGIIISRGAEGPEREIFATPPVRPYVCLSVRLSVRLSVSPSRLVFALTQKRIAVFSRNFADMCTMSWLYSFWCWWYVVWIFYEFFKYWINNKILRFFFSKIHVFFTFHAISNINAKKNWCNNTARGGGGGELNFFLEKQFFLI